MLFTRVRIASPSVQQSRSRPTELVSHSHHLPFTTDNCHQSLHSHSLPVSFACAHIASPRPLLPTLPIESPPQQSPSSMTQFLADTVTCPVSSSSRLAVLTDVSTSRSGCPCAITTRRRLCAFSPLPALDSPLTPASPLRVSPPPLSQSEQCDLLLGLLQHHEGNGTRHISSCNDHRFEPLLYFIFCFSILVVAKMQIASMRCTSNFLLISRVNRTSASNDKIKIDQSS
jgi:hypothetical protein